MVEMGRKREKGADTGPKLSQSKTLNPSWAHELNLGWLLPASARRHTALSKTVFSEKKPERDSDKAIVEALRRVRMALLDRAQLPLPSPTKPGGKAALHEDQHRLASFSAALFIVAA